ncbi:MAG: UvrD-helicase domain-containing protein [Candidatus Omnitrophica bacterium]|nr:UvrD-helicase domain-containing protein [Candidatus Omnitrophota bacterium]
MSSSKAITFQFPELRVVEASAGSGKTYALAKRYVQLLLNPSLAGDIHPFKKILAITFTNKAAFEMKARIIEFLKRLALKQMTAIEEEMILRPIGVSAVEASRKAFDIMEDLIHHYNFFQVQTIDSFINSLLAGCSFKVGLTAHFRISTNAIDCLEYCLAEVLDQAKSDKRVYHLFKEFLHNYLYLENRTGWLPKKDILLIMQGIFQQYNTYGFSFEVSRFSAEAVFKQKKKVLEDIKKLSQELPEGTNGHFTKSLSKFLRNNENSFDIDSISDFFARKEFPVRKGIKVSSSIGNQWQKIGINLQQLCDQEAASLFNPYIHIFNEVKERFDRETAKDDLLFLEQLNKKASGLFEDDRITVEEVYFRLATRFNHYLIDEFQDTSRLQWRNVEPMAAEGLSSGGSLFYVGDRKQAIYGFRGGDIHLFDELRDLFQDYNVQNEFLTKNWRSEKAVVDFNNMVFDPANLETFIRRKEEHEKEKNKKTRVVFSEQDVRHLAGIFKGARQTHREECLQGYVKVDYIDSDKKEERDAIIREKLLTTLQELKGRFALQDIALLTRSNSQVEQLTGWLLEEGFVVESERTSNIKQNSYIEEIIFFLVFLNSPIDNIAFAKFILGDIFAAATEKPAGHYHDFLFSLRDKMSANSNQYIYTEFRRAFPDLWEAFIDPFFRNVGLYPLYELVVSIYHKFDVTSRFAAYHGFFMHFLEIIKSSEDEYGDIASFLEQYEKMKGEALYVPVTERNAVKITTVHKSKGLEFPVVILPFLAMDVQIGTKGEDSAHSYVLQQSDEAMRLIRLKEKYCKFSDELYQIYRQEYYNSFLSELNNIYVSLTRAKRELYAFIPKKAGQGFNIASLLIPEQNYEGGRRVKGYSREGASSEFLTLPGRAAHDWIEYLKDEFLDVEALQRLDSKLKGEVMHFILSFIKDLLRQDLEQSLAYACQQARASFPQVTDIEEYQARIEELLKAKDLKEIFYIDEGLVFTEKEIVNKAGDTKRVDRLVVKKDVVWVIDYKSAEDPLGRQKEQIEEYCAILKEVYPKRNVEGYLVYLDSLKLDKIYSHPRLRGV